MANETDDLYLDLSYMDENDTSALNGNDASQYAGQDDSADLYGDEQPQAENIEATDDSAEGKDPGLHGGDVDNNSEQAPAVQSEVTEAPVKQESYTADTSASKKRKERDDDEEEYSQTLSQGQSQTPRPSSTTPMTQMGYGQQATDALNVQQLTSNTNEETIREWANAIGRETEIVDIKFDEHKPNGKSKG